MLMNLVLAESIIAGFGIPVDFTASLLRGWKQGRWMCYATGFLLTLSGGYSVTIGKFIQIKKIY